VEVQAQTDQRLLMPSVYFSDPLTILILFSFFLFLFISFHHGFSFLYSIFCFIFNQGGRALIVGRVEHVITFFKIFI